MKAILLAALAAALTLAPAASAVAAEDPERNSSSPTGWHWLFGASPAEIDRVERDAGARVISINADAPGRFSAALVHNGGVYKRDGDWFQGKTPAQVAGRTKGRRLIDLEPYVDSGELRFAGVTVPNSGASGKGWWWNYGLSAEQVAKDIDKHNLRLVDLAVYQDGGQRRFAYVGVVNGGEDARSWWWYYDVSPSFVQRKVEEHGARLVDIERHDSDSLTVVMVKNSNVFSRHVYGASRDYIDKYVQSQGVRVTDLERHGDRYYATMIDNVDAETGRIRSLLRASPYRFGYFGAYSKKVGGPTYVGLAHQARYQPLSVLKLLPHLYVMDLVDRGRASLDDTITWKSPRGKPDDVACFFPGTPTSTYSDSLRNVLTRGLGESLGRAHESLLDDYTPEAITARMHQLGLENTDIHYGCKYEGKNDWFANRSTLTDLGELFEGVETKRFFLNDWKRTRDEFYGLMANWSTEPLRAVVADEAAKAGKRGVVDRFMESVTVDGKGGGGDFGSDAEGWKVGRALSYRVTLPFRAPRRRGGPATVVKSFVGGFFVNDTKGPCQEWVANTYPDTVDAECKAFVKELGETWSKLTGELQRVPIREALATW
jgi:Beta-lactamase enzyme family